MVVSADPSAGSDFSMKRDRGRLMVHVYAAMECSDRLSVSFSDFGG